MAGHAISAIFSLSLSISIYKLLYYVYTYTISYYLLLSMYWLSCCRQERMLAKRKKTLRVSKSNDDAAASSIIPSGSPLSQLKKRVNDSISALDIDIPDSPVTPSPLTDPCSTLGGATMTTVESGVGTSPPSMNCLHEVTQDCKCLHVESSVSREKLKVARTESDILNHNDSLGHDHFNLNAYHDTDT